MESDKQQPGHESATRQADIYDLWAWFEVNKMRVAAVAVALVVIGFAVATIRYMRQQTELEASTALLALKPALTPPTNAPVQQASAYLKLAEDFKGTSAGERAAYYAGTVLFGEGKYAEAETAFSGFLRDHSGSPWAPLAAYGVAASQEAQNKAEAMASYQNVATAYSKAGVADQARLALARIYETKNQPDQALRMYNEIASATGGESALQSEALSRREILLRTHPNLDTNRLSKPISTVPATSSGTNATLSLPQTNAPAASSNAPAEK